MADRVVLLSIPQLRHRDVTPGALASLDTLTGQGCESELIPTFPGLSAASFATLVTGVDPSMHGLLGDSYFDRQSRQVVIAPLRDDCVPVPKIWERVKAIKPGARTLLWFAPNAIGAKVDFDGWLDSERTFAAQPEGLSKSLVQRFGPFPNPYALQKGEPPRLDSTSWILQSAGAVIAEHRPEMAVIRVPYLGQIARRFGPDGREAGRAVRELEVHLSPFINGLPSGTAVVAATESVVTPVSGLVFPNRVLRELGLLAFKTLPGGGLDVDCDRSAAFALADHQICHIYVNDPAQVGSIASTFAGDYSDNVASVLASTAQKAERGLDHPRSGDVVMIAHPDSWFASDWWTDPAEVPVVPAETSGLAHSTATGLLDPDSVKGSLGASPLHDEYMGMIVVSEPNAIPASESARVHARDVAGIVLSLLSNRSG